MSEAVVEDFFVADRGLQTLAQSAEVAMAKQQLLFNNRRVRGLKNQSKATYSSGYVGAGQQ